MTRLQRVADWFTFVAIFAVCTLLAFAIAKSTGQPADRAPMPHPAEDDGLPNVRYYLPPESKVPEKVSVLEDTGDVRDWGIGAIGVPDAWKVTKGKGAVVAVLDTGCDVGHRDLAPRVIGAKDFTGSKSGPADVQGHGTHCVGVVAAAENGTGMVGVAPESSILAYKVLGDNGSGLSTWIAAGIDAAVLNGADVISMSLGSSTADARIAAAIKRALDKGVIVVAAAGNSGPGKNTVGYPGGLPGVVCVAAVDASSKVAGFSSRGAQVTVAAPGVSIKSCYPGDRFATMSGTSMATPHVAGCAALYVAACKNRKEKPTPAEFAKLLANTSKDLPPDGRDTATGFGLIQPAKFVGSPVIAPVPKPPESPEDDRVVMEFEPALPFPGGRKLKRITYDFDPVIVPNPMPVKP